MFHVTDQRGNKLSESDVAERIQQVNFNALFHSSVQLFLSLKLHFKGFLCSSFTGIIRKYENWEEGSDSGLAFHRNSV